MRFSELSPLEQDMILWQEESLSPHPYRAGGDVPCIRCGFLFRQHPYAAEAAGPDTGEYGTDELVYRQLCNGDLVKL